MTGTLRASSPRTSSRSATTLRRPTPARRASSGRAEQWQAVILDLMLPGMDGFEVLKRIREPTHVPVLMLTARGDEADRIVGLEIGADDYLPKTFSTPRAAGPPPRRDPAPARSGAAGSPARPSWRSARSG